jgi:trehalose-6-phosphate synthase
MTLPAANLIAQGNLQDRAMVASLTLRKPAMRKTDKRITTETNSTRGIAQHMGNYTKRLIAPEALDAIFHLDGQWRNWHLSITLPWGDNGDRLLPTPLFTTYAKRSREFEAARAPLVQAFVQAYPQHYADAKHLLGADFNPADYPPAYTIADRFGASWHISEFPDPTDYRLPSSLSQQDADAIRAAAVASVQETLRDANLAIIKRLLEPVQHMVTKLRAYDAAQQPGYDGPNVRFHDSLIENLEAVIALIPAFNIAGDPIVTDFARQCVNLLAHAPEDLRTDHEARTQVADEADRIAAAMGQFV